jgi:hypothetical protein
MVTFREFIRSPKGIATVVGASAAAAGVVGFYIMMSRRRVITVAFDKSTVKACTAGETNGVTISIADGFGRPLPFKKFYLQVYFDSYPAFEEPVQLTTGADGTWRLSWSEEDWYSGTAHHVDTQKSETITWEVTCDGQTGYGSYTAVFTACTNFTTCCRTAEGKVGYHCTATCPPDTTPC